MIEQIDFYVRIMMIGAGIMLIAQIAAGDVREAIKLPLVAMLVGVMGYLLNATPLLTSDGPLDPWIDLVSISAPFSIWLFARNLFEREPERRFILIAAAVMLAGWFLGNFVDASGALGFYILHLAALILLADLVRVGVFERKDDLVEQRRVIRLWLPLLAAAIAGGILSYELVEAITGVTDRNGVVNLFNSLLILISVIFAGIALMRADPELLVGSDDNAQVKSAVVPELSASDAVLHDKLTVAMEAGAYREPGLTIASLADQLETPEHRLRALINRRLGYRNFSAFLNRHRIAEAREALVDREKVDLPVLTIAMDLGYNSLPTFNRAFRSETGTTPSEFRRLGLVEATGQN